VYSLAVHRKVKVDDTHLHVAEAGSGPSLVFFHGLGWTHALWAAAFDRYAERYRVIAGDTRGHGESGKPAGPYSIARFAADWIGVLDALDVKNPILVGFSQGGMIAQQLAVNAPSRYKALFLACTTSATNPVSFANMEKRVNAMETEGPAVAARLALESVFSPAYRSAHAAQAEQFIRWRTAADPVSLASAMLATRDYDVRAGLGSLSMPRRVVCGGADTLTPPARVAETASGLGTALYSIEGSGHMVQIEQPERFYAELDLFLLEVANKR